MRFIFLSALFFVAFFCCAFTQLGPGPAGVKTVVIDAGHGGHDPGCKFGNIEEKKVALSIALKVGNLIKENCKDVSIIYTRADDTFVELWERALIANRNHAAVFISIHCNANKTTTVYGTETYTMGLHKSDDNLEVAKRENEVILMEDDYTERYDGFDPKSPESDIIFELFQDAYMDQSLRLAAKVESQFKDRVKRKSRGVKQAGFVVLWKTAMPSILVETGFLSNPTERAFLTSDAGQNEVASGIFRAFKEFKTEVESTSP
ncbi:MAG: N-acetylmuramoyl-L-alanine amidase [Bacteroidota bacterium]|nr:N-acetylmuramoyl-L-alanine amidase [Bacteroidota bacterium]